MLRSLAHSILLALLLGAGSAVRLAAQTPWLTTDTVERVVSLRLDVTAPQGSPSALISGYREGGVQVVVPRGWTVAWQWESHDSTAPHSLVLMAEREKLPTEGGRPALEDALTRAVTTGLDAGTRDVARFEADEVGWYWLLCGVPGHALKGEWIGLKIDPDATAPSLKEKARQ
ncbi:MAG: sulfocyanin-like copper-binding protein [Gemmatimonadales bacterium]